MIHVVKKVGYDAGKDGYWQSRCGKHRMEIKDGRNN